MQPTRTPSLFEAIVQENMLTWNTVVKRGTSSLERPHGQFKTVPGYSHIDLRELRQFEIPALRKPLRKGPIHQSCNQHTLGNKYTRLHRDGRVEFIKAVGIFEAPCDPAPLRPRCKRLRDCSHCDLCLRRQAECNTCHIARGCKTFHLTQPPTPKIKVKLTYFT